MIVTFYSYKGGTGRTMALANIAVLLARGGRRVLMVDFDLEAPGLPRFFARYAPDLAQQAGLIDLLPRSADWHEFVTPIAIDTASTLDMITSGRQDENYAARVLDFQWQRFFEESDGGAFVESLRKEWTAEYDFVLIDSRTGITDTGGICTIALPDIIVPVFTANQQSVDGVIEVLRRAQAGRQSMAYDRTPAAVLPLPSKLDTRTELESAQEWMDLFAERFAPFYDDWLPRHVPVRKVIERTKLPYVAYFSFGEQLPVLSHGTTDPDSLGHAMNLVATLLSGHLSDAAAVFDPAPGAVTQVDPEDTWDFYISHTQQDRAWAEWIAWELEENGCRVFMSRPESGAEFVATLSAALAKSSRVIAVVSNAYLESKWTTSEFQAAWTFDPAGEAGKLVPIRVEDVERRGLLGSLVSADLFGISEEAARDALRNLAAGARRESLGRPAFPRRRIFSRPRFPAALPKVWNVPPRNRWFVGRDEDLAVLRRRLRSGDDVGVCAVHGLPGVGKSQVAVEYAHRFAHDYDTVWWIPAGERPQVEDLMVTLGHAIGLGDDPTPSAVRSALRSRSRWLLVFDNAEDYRLVRDNLPSGSGDVLITTRRSGFGAFGHTHDLGVFARDDSTAMLTRRLPDLSSHDADEVAALVGDLPLALELAAAFLETSKLPASQYVELLRTRTIDALSRAADRGQSFAAVLEPVLETVFDERPAALQLLELLAWLALEPVPLDLLRSNADRLSHPLARAVRDPMDFADCISALDERSLVRRMGNEVVVTHRLVQLAVRASHIRGPADSERLEEAIELLAAYLLNEPASGQRWESVLPHVLAVCTHEPLPERSLPLVFRLLAGAAGHLSSHGETGALLPLWARSLKLAEGAHGWTTHSHDLIHGLVDALDYRADSLALAQTLRAADPISVDLSAGYSAVEGLALIQAGRIAEARPHLERALTLQEAEDGHDHPNVATVLRLLGFVYATGAEHDLALRALERALAIDERAHGPAHESVVNDLAVLGYVLQHLGDADTARQVHERALATALPLLGPDHPVVVQLQDYLTQGGNDVS